MKTLVSFEDIKKIINETELSDLIDYQGGISTEFTGELDISSLELRISFRNSSEDKK